MVVHHFWDHQTNKSRRHFVIRLILLVFLFFSFIILWHQPKNKEREKEKKRKTELYCAVKLSRDPNTHSPVFVAKFFFSFFDQKNPRKHIKSARFHCNLNHTFEFAFIRKIQINCYWQKKRIEAKAGKDYDVGNNMNVLVCVFCWEFERIALKNREMNATSTEMRKYGRTFWRGKWKPNPSLVLLSTLRMNCSTYTNNDIRAFNTDASE